MKLPQPQHLQKFAYISKSSGHRKACRLITVHCGRKRIGSLCRRTEKGVWVKHHLSLPSCWKRESWSITAYWGVQIGPVSFPPMETCVLELLMQPKSLLLLLLG